MGIVYRDISKADIVRLVTQVSFAELHINPRIDWMKMGSLWIWNTLSTAIPFLKEILEICDHQGSVSIVHPSMNVISHGMGTYSFSRLAKQWLLLWDDPPHEAGRSGPEGVPAIDLFRSCQTWGMTKKVHRSLVIQGLSYFYLYFFGGSMFF